jgi:hypothetical protein
MITSLPSIRTGTRRGAGLPGSELSIARRLFAVVGCDSMRPLSVASSNRGVLGLRARLRDDWRVGGILLGAVWREQQHERLGLEIRRNCS